MELGYAREGGGASERALLEIQENSPYWRWDLVQKWQTYYGVESKREYTRDAFERVKRDDVLERYILPLYYDEDANPLAPGCPEDEKAVRLALKMHHNRGCGHHCLADQLEAGIMAGLPAGEALPPEVMSREAQIVYELLFFDVRGRLKDPVWLIQRVFGELQLMEWKPASAPYTWGRLARLLAYALGFEEYAGWRDGKPSEKVLRLLDLRERLDEYLTALWELGLEGYESWVIPFNWLLVQADRLRAGEPMVEGVNAFTGSGPRTAEDRLRYLKGLHERVPPPPQPHR